MGNAVRKSKVLPIPTIRQDTLKEYLRIDEERKALGRQVRALDAEQDAIRNRLMDALRQGETIETGPLSASVEPGRRNVAWKDVVLRRLGQAVVDEETANAVPSETLKVSVR